MANRLRAQLGPGGLPSSGCNAGSPSGGAMTTITDEPFLPLQIREGLKTAKEVWLETKEFCDNMHARATKAEAALVDAAREIADLKAERDEWKKAAEEEEAR